MSQKKAGKEETDATNRLKRVVEQSLALLGESKRKEDAGGRNPPPRSSSCSSLPLYVDAANLQETALANAAKALTALWKVSQPVSGKLADRALHFSR